MKKQIQTINTTGQSTVEVRKSQKHDANLQKNSTLYFQVGLILCLLGTFFLFEMEFKSELITPDTAQLDDPVIEYQMKQVKAFVPEAKPEIKRKVSTRIIDKIKVVDHQPKDIIESIVTTEPTPTSTPITTLNPEDIIVDDIIDDVPVDKVQFVPIFPGCEKFDSNADRKKCLNEKMSKLVQRKFNKDIATDYGLSGLQRIYVEFKVDKSGAITGIKTRAPHKKLEQEALRIANKIPRMEPGKMGAEPVNVIYTLPIVFNVQN